MPPRFSLSLEVTCDNGFLAGFRPLHGEGAVGLADDAVDGFHRRKHHTRTLRMQPNYWARWPAEALSDDPPRRVAAREVGPCVTLSLKFWAVDYLPPPCSEIDGAVIGRERSFHHAALVLADVVVHVLRRPLETIDNLSCPQPSGSVKCQWWYQNPSLTSPRHIRGHGGLWRRWGQLCLGDRPFRRRFDAGLPSSG